MMGTVGVGTTLPLDIGVVWSGEPVLPGLGIALSVGELADGVWDGASVVGPSVSEGILGSLIDGVELSWRTAEEVSFGLSAVTVR